MSSTIAAEGKAEPLGSHLRRLQEWEMMLAQLQEIGARFGVVVTIEDVRRALPQLWPRMDAQQDELRQRTKEAFLVRAYAHTERDRHHADVGFISKQLDELRQENETLRQRLSVYEPAEGQP